MSDSTDTAARPSPHVPQDVSRALPETPDEAAWIDLQMQDWKPRPFIDVWEEDEYDGDEEPDRPTVDGQSLLNAPLAQAGAVHAPSAQDASWTPPSPADRAKAIALLVGGFTHEEMASHFAMSVEQLRWAFASEIENGRLQVRALLTTKTVADGLSRPGAARTRLSNNLGVLSERPAPPVGGVVPLNETRMPHRSNRQRDRRIPKPGPDGIIDMTMRLGDRAMRERFDVVDQTAARRAELLSYLRSKK